MTDKHRKCDTAKYRKRMARQRANVRGRKERERIQAALERDRALAARMEAERRHRNDPRTQLGQRLVNVLHARLVTMPGYKLMAVSTLFGIDMKKIADQYLAVPPAPSPLAVPVLTPGVDIRPTCALCRQPFTLEDNKAKNCKPIQYNRRWVVVHITCPMKA